MVVDTEKLVRQRLQDDLPAAQRALVLATASR
jgi:hypothetical protein